MSECPSCGSEITSVDPSREECPHCGVPLAHVTSSEAASDSRATLGVLSAQADCNAPVGAMPNLLDVPPSLDTKATFISAEIPSAVNFGPASQPWPLDPGEITARPGTTFAPASLHTITSLPSSSDEADATDAGQRPLQTIESGLGISPEAIANLWRDSHSSDTSPRTTIRPREELTGSPRDSRLILTSRSIRQTQSPLRASADYELLETIGEGGVGVVYAARQASIDRTVAVKMLKPASAQKPEQRDKFLSEAVVTGDLDHPNIVPIYDLGTNESGALFYSMKRVQGTPWASVLAQKSLPENLEILLKVADAVGFAHSRGVIHRDLKPENVMLGEYGEVLVMDWGLAVVTPQFRKARTISSNTSMGGTPAYMAPEMATGPVERVSQAADVYLLGAILYEIITGQPPHMAKTVAACLVAAARNQIQPTQYQGELLEIALTAMATLPEKRYSSAREFQTAVRQYQAHSESIVLSNRADRELAEARQNDDYELFSRAVFGFQEAFALWDDNTRAASGVSEARLSYAQSAADKGDYDLAASLLDAADPSHKSLLDSVIAAQRERALRQQRLKNAKRVAAALAASMLVIVTGALIWVSHLYGVAEHETQVAKDQKSKADIAKDLAVRNEQEAKVQTAKAERAKSEEQYSAYIAKIGLGAAKVEENAFGEVDQLLEQCPAALRNWEWGRLKFLCGRALRTFAAGAPLDAVAFDRDGKRFVTGGSDGKVRVWSIKNDAQPLLELDYGNPHIFAVAVAPDGQHVVAGGDDGRGYVKIWNIDTRELVRVLGGHTEGVLSVAYNRDGSRLLTASYDATARLWDTATGESLRTFKGHTWWVWSAEFSPNEDAIVTAGQDRKCIVWPLDDSGDQNIKQLRIFTGHDGPVYSAVFSPDGQHVVSGGYDNRVLVWHRDEAKPFPFEALSAHVKSAPPVFRALESHTAAVRSIRFSAQAPARIITASHDNTIKVWDFKTGALIQTLRGHAGWVRGCDVAPDGRTVVSVSHDRQAKLWNLEGYEEVRVLNARVLSGHADAVLSASFSANGEHLLTSSRDRTARIWSFATGEMVQSFSEGHEFLASHAILFRDGRRFLTSGIDSTVRIWDMANGTEIRALKGTGASGLVALSRDERWILTANGDAALLWDVESGELVRKFGDHRGDVSAIAFAPDARYVFTGDLAGRTRLWDRASGDIVWDQRAHSDGVNAAAFLPDGSRVLTASNDNTVGQFDVATGKDLIHETLRHDSAVTALVVASDGRRAVTNAADGKIRIWNLKDRRIEHELADFPSRVSDFSLSDDGQQLVTVAPLPLVKDEKQTSGQPSVIQFWKIESGQELPQTRMQAPIVWSAIFAPISGQVLLVGGDRASLCAIGNDRPMMSFSPHGAVTSAHYSPDQTRIVTSGGDASAKVWDVATGAPLFKLALAHTAAVNSAVYSPDGRFILTSSDDGTARLWDASTGEPLQTCSDAQTSKYRIRSAAFSPDGRLIVTASGDKAAHVWRTSGELLLSLKGHRAAVVCASFSRDGLRIVTGSEDHTARLWDARTGKPIGDELAGHTASVTSVCFSPDGKRILSGSQDSTAKLWDAQTAKEILTLKGHREEVTSVSFSANGRYALTGSRDGTAIVWLTEEWRDAPGIAAVK